MRAFTQGSAKDTEKTKRNIRSSRRTRTEVYPRNNTEGNFNMENHSEKSKEKFPLALRSLPNPVGYTQADVMARANSAPSQCPLSQFLICFSKFVLNHIDCV